MYASFGCIQVFFIKIILQRRQVCEIECESVSVFRVRWVVCMPLLGVYSFFLKIMLQRRQVSKVERESVSVFRVRWVVCMPLLGVYSFFLNYVTAQTSL